MMELTEQLISSICKDLHGTYVVPYGDHMIDLTPPWRRVTMYDLVKEKTGIDFTTFMQNSDVEGAKAAAISAGVPREELNKVESAGTNES